MEELRKEEVKKEIKISYDIDGLMELVKPFKISTDDVEQYDKKRKNDAFCIFVSIYRCYPKTHITVEFCKEKNQHGDIITMSDKIFRANIPGLYKYCDESIDTILKWQRGHEMILGIDKNLINMEITDIEKVNNYIIDLLDSKEIEKTVDKKDTQVINISKLKEALKDDTGKFEIPSV